MPEFVTPDIWIRGGLLDEKHRDQIGEAIWLYLYLHQHVRFSGADAGVSAPDQPYRHTDAAHALGLSLRAVKYQFDRLESSGYITSRRTNHGLTVAITKYVDASTRAAARRSRVQPIAPSQVQSIVEPSATDGKTKCNPSSSRVQSSVPVYKEDKRTRESTPPRPVSRAGAREPTEHQVIVNAYYDGLGRDPLTARDYGRHVAAGAELHDNHRTPQDVRNCTKWLASDPWRRSNGRMPSLADVAVSLPGWIEDKRPAKYSEPIKNGRSRETNLTGIMRGLAAKHAERSPHALPRP